MSVKKIKLHYNLTKITGTLREFVNSLVCSLRGWAGRNQSPVMWPVWLWHDCILDKSLGVVCHCFPPPLDVRTFADKCLYVRSDARDSSSDMWNCGL